MMYSKKDDEHIQKVDEQQNASQSAAKDGATIIFVGEQNVDRDCNDGETQRRWNRFLVFSIFVFASLPAMTLGIYNAVKWYDETYKIYEKKNGSKISSWQVMKKVLRSLKLI